MPYPATGHGASMTNIEWFTELTATACLLPSSVIITEADSVTIQHPAAPSLLGQRSQTHRLEALILLHNGDIDGASSTKPS
jgi:hypothetical protein